MDIISFQFTWGVQTYLYLKYQFHGVVRQLGYDYLLQFAHGLACCSYNFRSTLISFFSTTLLGWEDKGRGGVSMGRGK